MTLPDGEGAARWETQIDAWKRLAQGLSGLDASLSIRLLAYDSAARKLVTAGADALDHLLVQLQVPPMVKERDVVAAVL